MARNATPAMGKSYRVEIRDAIEAGNRGDPASLPAIKKAFDEHPELAEMLGDLSRLANVATVNLIAGHSLTAREAISRQADILRERLLAEGDSELERLLAERVVVSWLQAGHADQEYAGSLQIHPSASPVVRATATRLGRAQARHLAAVKGLATVRKLCRPARSPLELLGGIAETDGRKGPPIRASVDPRIGLTVAN